MNAEVLRIGLSSIINEYVVEMAKRCYGLTLSRLFGGEQAVKEDRDKELEQLLPLVLSAVAEAGRILRMTDEEVVTYLTGWLKRLDLDNMAEEFRRKVGDSYE